MQEDIDEGSNLEEYEDGVEAPEDEDEGSNPEEESIESDGDTSGLIIVGPPVYPPLPPLDRNDSWTLVSMKGTFDIVASHVENIVCAKNLRSYNLLFSSTLQDPHAMFYMMKEGMIHLDKVLVDWEQEDLFPVNGSTMSLWNGLLSRMYIMVSVLRSIVNPWRSPREQLVQYRHCANTVLQAAACIDRYWSDNNVFVRLVAPSCRTIDFNMSMWLDESNSVSVEVLTMAFPLVTDLVAICTGLVVALGYFGHEYE